jgi:hypothetical protein
MVKRCAFCPTEATKLSGEHLWDDWLNRAVSTKGYKARYGTLTQDAIEWDAGKLNHKLPVVCSACNSTWMAQLGDRVKAGFSGLILEGAALSILPSGLSVLSGYTFLKAGVADYTYCDGEPFFTRAARERFRTSLSIPGNTQIWIGSFQGEAAFSTRCNIRHYENTQPGTPFFGVEWFAFTYVIGRLLVQLLAPRWKNILHRGLSLPVLSPNSRWDEAAVKIWPISCSYVSWPLSYLGDQEFNVFAHRFGARVEVRHA